MHVQRKDQGSFCRQAENRLMTDPSVTKASSVLTMLDCAIVPDLFWPAAKARASHSLFK